MAIQILTSQLAVEATTITTLLLTILLALIITNRYAKKKTKSLLFWSLGIWCFVVGVFLEVLFAVNIYSNFLIGFYLLIVGLLVEFLALGSVQLLNSKKINMIYYTFAILTTLLLLYSIAVTPIGNVITHYIVYGNIPIFVVLTSSLVTFPAAIILIYTASISFIKTANKKLLGIILGVIIVSIAGTLYIVQYPAFLYIAEFVGILLLWYGFI